MRKKLLFVSQPSGMGILSWLAERALNREVIKAHTVGQARNAIDNEDLIGTYIRGLHIQFGGYMVPVNDQYPRDGNYSGGIDIIRHSLSKGLKTVYQRIDESDADAAFVRALGAEFEERWSGLTGERHDAAWKKHFQPLDPRPEELELAQE